VHVGRAARHTLLVLSILAFGVVSSALANAPAPLSLGFSSDSVLVGGNTASRAPWITRALGEGGSVVRVNVPWSFIAPSRPLNPTDSYSSGYNWSAIDGAVHDLSARGLRVCLMLYRAPSWAEGAGGPTSAEEDGAWRPNPVDFGQFATAAARRYDGQSADPLHPGHTLPRVSCWQGWNEPNINYYLAPQWVSDGGQWKPVAVTLYRELLNRFYRAVKAVSPTNTVMMAGTAPIGFQPGTHGPGIMRTSPVAFYRQLFCLKGRDALKPYRCPAVYLDGIDHHPQVPNPPTWHAPNPDDAAVPDISRVTRVLKAAVADGHVLPHVHKTIWVTELEWSSNPPSPRGVPLDTVAHWYEQAFYELWGQGVDTIMPLELADPPPVPGNVTEYQSGLFFQNGQPKPVATAYRFPFVVAALGHNRVQAWGRAPQGGSLRVETLRHGHWQVMKTISVRPSQVFSTVLSSPAQATWRATIGSQASLAWTLGAYEHR
jgi:hypothetical protein